MKRSLAFLLLAYSHFGNTQEIEIQSPIVQPNRVFTFFNYKKTEKNSFENKNKYIIETKLNKEKPRKNVNTSFCSRRVSPKKLLEILSLNLLNKKLEFDIKKMLKEKTSFNYNDIRIGFYSKTNQIEKQFFYTCDRNYFEIQENEFKPRIFYGIQINF
jgi:hypothetical protein